MKKKKHKLSLSQEEFLKRMNDVFGNLYDFSESMYINLLTKVKCICPKHGEFWSRPDHLMNGHGCPKCAIEKRANKERLTLEEVKLRIDEIFNKKYDTSKIQYKNFNEKIILICPIHGEFKSSPAHLFKGHSCPKCGNVGRKTTESFKEELIKITVDDIPKEFAQSLYSKKQELSEEIKKLDKISRKIEKLDKKQTEENAM